MADLFHIVQVKQLLASSGVTLEGHGDYREAMEAIRLWQEIPAEVSVPGERAFSLVYAYYGSGDVRSMDCDDECVEDICDADLAAYDAWMVEEYGA